MNAYIQMLTEYDVVVKTLEATLILLEEFPILGEENSTIYIPMFLHVLLIQLLVDSIIRGSTALGDVFKTFSDFGSGGLI